MTTLSNIEIIAIVFVVVVGIVLVGLLLFLIKRMKARRNQLHEELDGRPELAQDRAFNRLAMARREAGLLAAQGVDVGRAQERIAEAQGAFDTHQYDEAYREAQLAHEALVNARRQGTRSVSGPLPSAAGAAPTSGTSSHVGGESATLPTRPSVEPARPAIPKNRAESQFQIRILGEELDALPARRARNHAGTEAAELKRQASGAFEKGDYTEAFRLALRGRRTLGSSLETLPPTGPGPTRAPPTEGGNGTSGDVARTAESVAEGARCPDCGYPTVAGDTFCRGCGKPRAPLTCATCGAPRGADEPFCGRCGARFP